MGTHLNVHEVSKAPVISLIILWRHELFDVTQFIIQHLTCLWPDGFNGYFDIIHRIFIPIPVDIQ